MFFGGLFTAYVVYRTAYPAAFHAASHQLDITLGAFNTVVLITSSLTMALAVHAAQVGKRGMLVVCLHPDDGARLDLPRRQGVRVLRTSCTSTWCRARTSPSTGPIRPTRSSSSRSTSR